MDRGLALLLNLVRCRKKSAGKKGKLRCTSKDAKCVGCGEIGHCGPDLECMEVRDTALGDLAEGCDRSVVPGHSSVVI